MKNLLKYIIALLTVTILRLIPHPPNVEGITATIMPFGKRFGILAGMLFGALAILSFDLITGTLGPWTIMTLSMYTLIGAASGLFLKKSDNKISNYVIFAVIATILYDAVTGIGAGVLFFNQGVIATTIAQIPFTLMHLGGNIVFAAVISPLLYRWVLDNPDLDTQNVLTACKNLV